MNDTDANKLSLCRRTSYGSFNFKMNLVALRWILSVCLRFSWWTDTRWLSSIPDSIWQGSCTRFILEIHARSFKANILFSLAVINMNWILWPHSLRKQPSFFTPGLSGVSRNATRVGSEEGRLFSQAIDLLENCIPKMHSAGKGHLFFSNSHDLTLFGVEIHQVLLASMVKFRPAGKMELY